MKMNSPGFWKDRHWHKPLWRHSGPNASFRFTDCLSSVRVRKRHQIYSSKCRVSTDLTRSEVRALCLNRYYKLQKLFCCCSAFFVSYFHFFSREMNKNGSNKSKKCVISWETHPKNLLKNFCSLMEHQSLVDVVLSCGSNTIQAHKFVLAANSPLFRVSIHLFINTVSYGKARHTVTTRSLKKSQCLWNACVMQNVWKFVEDCLCCIKSSFF